MGEAFRTYLIIEYGDDELLLIDKHADHERILYEKLKKESGKSCAQYLLEPIPVTLDKNEYAAVLENQKLFWEAGFEAVSYTHLDVYKRQPRRSGNDRQLSEYFGH